MAFSDFSNSTDLRPPDFPSRPGPLGLAELTAQPHPGPPCPDPFLLREPRTAFKDFKTERDLLGEAVFDVLDGARLCTLKTCF